MKRVVYYARVSTEEEKQKSALQNQIGDLRNFVKSQPNWELVDEYIDEGKSATTTIGRSEYKRLYADLFENKFDIIVIKDLSRLNRNERDWYNFSEDMVNQDIRLYEYLEGRYYNPDEDILIAGFKSMINAQRSRDLSKKMKEANRKRIEKKRILTNGRMWGYTQNDGKLEIRSEEAELIKKIFEMYADGLGFRTIKNEIDSMLTNSIKSRRNIDGFALTTLKRIIRHTAYKGLMPQNKISNNRKTKKQTLRPEEEWSYIPCPAIVSEELWEKANKMLENKRKEYNLEDKRKIAGYFNGKYPLSGKITCGLCGRTYYHSKYNTMNYAIWECKGYREYGKKAPNGCTNIKLPTAEIDQIVKAVIFEFWKNKDKSIETVIKVLDKVLDNNDYKPQIDSLTKQIDKIKNYKRKARKELYDETITKEEYEADIKSFDNDLILLEKRLKTLSDKCEATVDKKERLENIKNKLNIEVKDINSVTDEIIEAMVQSVIVKANSLEITLNGDFSFYVDRENKKSLNVSNSGQD